MENFSFLLAAFVIVWALVFGYVALLLKRQRRLRRELDLLKESAGKQAAKG